MGVEESASRSASQPGVAARNHNYVGDATAFSAPVRSLDHHARVFLGVSTSWLHDRQNGITARGAWSECHQICPGWGDTGLLPRPVHGDPQARKTFSSALSRA